LKDHPACNRDFESALMIKKVFLDHPRSVGESYGEHLFQAGRFSLKLLHAAGACLIHALIPCLCERTGSKAITNLYDIMVQNRACQTSTRKNVNPKAGHQTL